MLTFPGVKADEPIAQAAAKEIRDVLGTHLGATLVESTDPLWPDDPGIENMTTSYTRALAKLVPIFFPDLLYRLNNQGQPVFPNLPPRSSRPSSRRASGSDRERFAGRLHPGHGAGAHPAATRAQHPDHPDIGRRAAVPFSRRAYLERRAADWKARGFTETLVDWAALDARSKFWSDEQRAMWKNWEEVADLLAPLGERQGVAERLMLRELLRRVEMKVIQENRLDVVVRLHTSLPPGKIGLAPWPGPAGDTAATCAWGLMPVN